MSLFERQSNCLTKVIDSTIIFSPDTSPVSRLFPTKKYNLAITFVSFFSFNRSLTILLGQYLRPLFPQSVSAHSPAVAPRLRGSVGRLLSREEDGPAQKRDGTWKIEESRGQNLESIIKGEQDHITHN